MPFLNSDAGEIEVQMGDCTDYTINCPVTIIFGENESVFEVICLSLTIAFSMEPFLIALKNIHFLWKTELKAILFTCETCLCSNKIISRRWCLVNPLAELGFICTLCYRSITRHCGGMSSLLSADISVLARRYLRPCPQISLPVALRVQRTLWHSGRSRLAGMLYF